MKKSEQYYISLGAGHNQKPLIQAAKNLGFKVIGIDKNLEAVGFPLCDIRLQESVLNYRKIHMKMNLAIFGSEIAGGFAASYGSALISWAFLAERAGLICLSRTHTEALLDKIYIRDKLSRSQITHPLFMQPKFLYLDKTLTRSDVEKIGFPIIIKTRNGSSKKNVTQEHDYSGAKKYLSKTNLEKLGINPRDVLIEECIGGKEITVVGLIENYKYHLVSVTDKITQSKPPFIELEHLYPSELHEMHDEIEAMHQQIVDELQISSSPLVSEFKYHNNKLYLVELSPQIPGEFIASFIIPSAIKYDFFKNLVLLTTGMPIEPPVFQKKPVKARIRFWDKKVPIDLWEDWRNKAQFARILNENPQVPPKSNRDRFGVMGFLE